MFLLEHVLPGAQPVGVAARSQSCASLFPHAVWQSDAAPLFTCRTQHTRPTGQFALALHWSAVASPPPPTPRARRAGDASVGRASVCPRHAACLRRERTRSCAAGDLADVTSRSGARRIHAAVTSLRSAVTARRLHHRRPPRRRCSRHRRHRRPRGRSDPRCPPTRRNPATLPRPTPPTHQAIRRFVQA